MSEPPPLVFTIGHSTRAIGAFVDLLRSHGVAGIVDVRAFPASRRNPQFGRDALEARLAEAGLGYRHMPALGGRRGKQDVANPDTHWRNPAFANYADYAKTEPFRAALVELEGLARAEPVAIMCAEALWWRCHRRIIADALAADGFAITHIMGPEPDRAPELPGL
jgi:uncharacterized protein (DUF488 family)